MVHYVFAWQVAALLMEVTLIPIMAARLREGSEAFPAAFLASDLITLARTLVFSTIHYDQSARLGLFPVHFEDGPVSGLIYIALISAAAWFLILGLFRTTRFKGPAWLALPFWAYISAVLLVFSLLIAGLDPPAFLRFLETHEDLAIRPFVVPKLLVIATCAYVAARLLLSGKRPVVPMMAALCLAAISQAGDIWFRLDQGSYLAALPLHYLGYFGALFLLSRRAGPVGRADPAPSGGLAGLWSREACLDENETCLLDLILCGKSNKEIAFALGLGLSAEKHRVQKLFRRLGVATRNELLARATEKTREAHSP